MAHKIKIGFFDIEFDSIEYAKKLLKLYKTTGEDINVCQLQLDNKIEIEAIKEREGFETDIDALIYINEQKSRISINQTKQHEK